jgi:hypothetical protein
MVQDSNTDVGRAMAALSVSQMPYHNFPDVTASPNAKDPSPRRAEDFPLLVSALPEAAQSPVPSTPAGRTLAPKDVESPAVAKPPPVTQHQSAEAVAERGRTGATAIPSETGPVQRKVVPQPHENAGPSLNFAPTPPFRRSVSFPASRQHAFTGPVGGTNESPTTLEVVFRILRSGDAPAERRNELQTGLQNMFRYL